MKNRKHLTIGQAVLSAACIALGLTLIVHPGFTGIAICRTAGAAGVALGAVKAYSALRWPDGGWLLRTDVTISVLLLAFGIFALVYPQGVLSVLPIVLGVYLLMECAVKIQRALALKQFGYIRWWIALAMGILAAVMGILLIVRPFQAAEAMLIFLGACLAVDGASELWILWCMAAHEPD